MNGIEDAVRRVPILARLSEPDLSALALLGRAHNYATGFSIVREGDPGDSLHIITEGSIRITVLSPDGEEATVALLGQGECFGELALLDGQPRSATAIALQETRTLVVTRNDFIQWLSERPRAALALLETLSLRLRRANEAFGDVVFLQLPQRLAKKLLDLAASSARPSTKGPGSGPVRLRMTQEELASMLAVSRESVNKQLNVFAREGWIALSRGSVTVIDEAALRELL